MARLPSDRFLVQQIGDDVVVFENHTEREIARFTAADGEAAGRAQQVIAGSELSAEDKTWAHFWSGYFYAHGVHAEAESS